MSTLEKLKAYFGMVPADDGYDDYPDDRYDDRYDDRHDLDRPADREVRREPRARAARRVDDYDEIDDIPVRGGGGRRPQRADAPVAGALAMEAQPERVTRLRPVAEQSPAPALGRDPLSRIVTLHPSSYSEAREIGEAFRDGNPVIMNLTEMDNADAKRLVDFAAGLALALRGSMDKVTNKVFLLSPSDTDVTAEDRRRIAEGGLFLRQ